LRSHHSIEEPTVPPWPSGRNVHDSAIVAIEHNRRQYEGATVNSAIVAINRQPNKKKQDLFEVQE
jgi:hypothetical protein